MILLVASLWPSSTGVEAPRQQVQNQKRNLTNVLASDQILLLFIIFEALQRGSDDQIIGLDPGLNEMLESTIEERKQLALESGNCDRAHGRVSLGVNPLTIN